MPVTRTYERYVTLEKPEGWDVIVALLAFLENQIDGLSWGWIEIEEQTGSVRGDRIDDLVDDVPFEDATMFSAGTSLPADVPLDVSVRIGLRDAPMTYRKVRVKGTSRTSVYGLATILEEELRNPEFARRNLPNAPRPPLSLDLQTPPDTPTGPPKRFWGDVSVEVVGGVVVAALLAAAAVVWRVVS